MEPHEEAAKRAKLMRRSSMLNVMRRQSRSVMGPIAIEDQAVAISSDPCHASKLASLMKIVVSATVGQAQQELEESSSDAISECADQINKSLRLRNEWDTVVRETWSQAPHPMARYLSDPARLCRALGASGSLVSSRVRDIQDYIHTLDAESQRWRAMAHELKEEYTSKRASKQACEKGAEFLGSDHPLAETHRPLLERFPAEPELMAEILEQEVALSQFRKSLTLAAKKRKKACEDEAIELQVAVKTLRTFSECVHGTRHGSLGLEELKKSHDFVQSVEKWLTEVHPS